MKTSQKRYALLVACSLLLGAVPTAFAGQDSEKHFKMMDSDGDGKISRSEHAAASKKMFTECDTNRDGFVTAREMDAVAIAHGVVADQTDKTSAEKIQMIDHDGDGRLSATESESGAEKMFDLMDKNADGALSKDECEQGQKLMKKSA